LAIQEAALQDPMKFVEKLQRGEDLGIPEPQVIAEVSLITIRIFDRMNVLGQGWANSSPQATCGPLRVFCGLPRQTEKFSLLSYPITADIEELQLELIDMQSDHTVKEMFNAVCDIS
jgi:hypothetical protein